MPRKPRLPDLEPILREQLAEWIDYQGHSMASRVHEAESLIRAGKGSDNMIEQAKYWRHCEAFASRLAWMVRTAVTKKLRSVSEPQPKP